MILVTGGTGLLGSHLLYELAKNKYKVTALRRSVKNIPGVRQVFSYYTEETEKLLDQITWIDADMLSYQEMLEATSGIDQVYHCAATVSFDSRKRGSMIRNNTTGTANIVNACLETGVKKLVHVSSTAAIGAAGDSGIADESMILVESKANTGYAISKFRSEMEVWRGIEEGLNAAIVNPSIILGPGFWHHGSSSIFTKVDNGLKFYSYGVTGYVGVWDVVNAMITLMESDISAERFLVTTGNYTYKDIFDKVADALERKRPGIEGTLFMSEMAWRLDWLKSRFFGIGEHTFTKERVRAARNVAKFSNEKVKKALDIEFEDIDAVIEKVAGYYKQTHKQA